MGFNVLRVIEWILIILGGTAAVITFLDSYRTRGVVFEAVRSGEPVVLALVLLQTPWLLFIILLAASLRMLRRKGSLNRPKVIAAAISSLIAGFLFTWGIRGIYFAFTGQTYPGQEFLEFRVQTFIAGILLFLFGSIILYATISSVQSKAKLEPHAHA